MPSQTQGKRRSAAVDGPVKRFRVSRACDQCRIERSKCDGNQPQCAPCFDTRRPCTYTSNPRKRGLPPGYMRTIELALALVIQQNADLEASLIAKLGQPNTVLLARDTKDSNRLHKAWRRTKFCRTLNKALTGDHVEHEDDKAVTSGEDSEPEPFLGEVSTIPNDAATTSQRPPTRPALNYRPLTTQPPEDMQRSKSYPQVTPLPPNCWKLLETYTTCTQCWLPISEKLDILKLSYAYPSQGLALSHAMPDAGHHAEMWSMFALGSLQETKTPQDQDLQSAITPRKLYSITQTLIPDELGKFHLGHVKALLNLALFNMTSSRYNAAWLLVGAASRIFLSIDDPTGPSSSRRPHVLASCFLLDSLLALTLDRRPYFETADLGRAGNIEEDGLEEWQPWIGNLLAGTTHPLQLPSLALSTFNNLLEVVDILSAASQHAAAPSPSANETVMKRVERWKATLSPKFDYVRSDAPVVPPTPPAVLLQTAHFATLLMLTKSVVWLQRLFDLLEPFRQSFLNLPSVLFCLLDCVRIQIVHLRVEQTFQTRLDDLIAAFKEAHTISVPQNTPSTLGDGVLGPARMSQSHGTPVVFNELIRPMQSQPAQPSPRSYPPQLIERPSIINSARLKPTSLIDDLLPDMHQHGQPLQTFDASTIETELTSPGFDTYDPSISGDLDNFLDELASLHGAKKIQNQSQFMENLGFAPEISMADLLATQAAQFIPMNPAFGADNDGGPLQFSLNDYYDMDRG